MSHSKPDPRRRESGAAFTYDHIGPVSPNTGLQAYANIDITNTTHSNVPKNSVPPPDTLRQSRYSTRNSFKIEQNQQLNETNKDTTTPAITAVITTLPVEKFELMKKRSKRILDSFIFQFMIAIFTLWALFSDNIRLAITKKSADIYFTVIISFIFFFFIYEIIIKLLTEEKYFHMPKRKKPDIEESFYDRWYRRFRIGSFYFYIDTISTFSLIIEMSWIVGTAFNQQTVTNGRTVSAGSIGARATKIIGLIRIVRLVRLIKIASSLIEDVDWFNFGWRTLFQRTKGKKVQREAESRVGAAMTELTNRRVTLFVLIMYVIIPLLSVSKTDYTRGLATQFIHQLSILNQTDPSTYENALELSISNCIDKTTVVGIQLNGNWAYYDGNAFSSLRDEELFTYELDDFQNNYNTYTKVVFDIKGITQTSAAYAIWTTLFIMALLSLGIFFFSKEVKRLVIKPIEKMVALVKKISANPLGVEYKVLGEKDGFVEGMETTILLTTITKIGGLMRVGFGEAGASIIARNLADSAGGKLNLMGAGTMIHSIFGFCDIRQFTDTTECLQEEVMLFVNRIAHILHGIVVQCKGAANKNIGDAFLLTWKIDDKLPSEEVYLLADQALLAFVRSLIELSRHQNFICNFSVTATAKLLTKFPDYKVRIGCGLHVGWAIEGAIGSNRKIDASYLSPHVSFTEYLESSTKKYGVSLLLSEPFFRLLSTEASSCCRQVDRVKPTEDENPLGLFTYDVDLKIDWVEIDRLKKARMKSVHSSLPYGNRRMSVKPRPTPRLSVKEIKRQREMDEAAEAVTRGTPAERGSKRAYELKQLKHASMQRGGGAGDMPEPDVENAQTEGSSNTEAPKIVLEPYDKGIWRDDPDLVLIRRVMDDKTRKLYEQGFNCYLSGDWAEASSLLGQVLEHTKGRDGPSIHLLDIINSNRYQGVAPHDWKGYSIDEDDSH